MAIPTLPLAFIGWFFAIASFAALAIGVLNGFSWGRTGLEYFCWVLIALTLLSGGTRLATYRQHPQGERLTPRGWVVAVAGVMLVALPLIALCGVTILTLRSDEVRQQLERSRS